MQKVVKDIMKLLKCDEQTALDIRNDLDVSGIDYSECSEGGFRKMVREAHVEWKKRQEVLS